MKRAIAAIAFAGLLTACATAPVDEAKATDIGWSGLTAAAQSATALAQSGKLHGASAVRVKADIDQATAILTAADNARQANPATDVTSQIAAAAALVSDIITITAGVPK